MKPQNVKKVLLNTALAGMIAGAGIGCTRSGEQKTSSATPEPTAVHKNGCGGKEGCGGKNGCQGTTATAREAVPGKDAATNSCRATGDRKAATRDGKGAKNSCAGKAGCA